MMERPQYKVVPELAAFGFAPGGYLNVCQDCPPGRDSLMVNAQDTNQFIGAKRSWRCEAHAREARDHFYATAPVRLNFGHALAVLRSGGRVAREGWNGKGMWIECQFPDAHSKMTLPYIFMRTAQGDLVPWLASQTDILSDDWVKA